MSEDKNNSGSNNGKDENNSNNAGNARPSDAEELLKKMRAIASDLWGGTPDIPAEPAVKAEKPVPVVLKRPDIGIDNLWMTADESIDWTDALAHEYPTDGLTNIRLWSFYHNQAENVLSGDIKVYAEVLKKANPLGELTAFANGISIRAQNADRAEAQFNCRKEYLEADGNKYLCAMGVRIARDLLACLPVSEIGVKAVQDGKTVMEVTYRREDMLHRNFTFLDPVKFTEECGAVFSEA